MNCWCGQESKYKCPRCSIRYCSVACFKQHKTDCKPPEDETKPEILVKDPPRNYLMEDEDELILTDQELSKLRESKELRLMLENTEIRKLLQDIDSAENRLGALRFVMNQDKTGDSMFAQCLDTMLRSIGYLNEEGVSIL